MPSSFVSTDTSTLAEPAGITAVAGMTSSEVSLDDNVIFNAFVVGVLRVTVTFPAPVTPSLSVTGLTVTFSDGPSLSATVSVPVTTPPFSGVVPQLHDAM